MTLMSSPSRSSSMYCKTSGVRDSAMASLAATWASVTSLIYSASPSASAIRALASPLACSSLCCASTLTRSSVFWASSTACSAATLASIAAVNVALNWKLVIDSVSVTMPRSPRRIDRLSAMAFLTSSRLRIRSSALNLAVTCLMVSWMAGAAILSINCSPTVL